jgi:hypothetical protein
MNQTRRRALAAVCCAAIVGCGGQRDGEINGDVFIVTKGGENFKLGLVTVKAIPAEQIREHIRVKTEKADAETANWKPKVAQCEDEQRQAKNDMDRAERVAFAEFSTRAKKQWDAATDRWSKTADRGLKMLGEYAPYHAGAYYFQGLPNEIANAKSDADGKFALRLRLNEKFALAAEATRDVGQRTEKYYWLLWVTLDGAASKRVMLSNDNMITSGSPESALSIK